MSDLKIIKELINMLQKILDHEFGFSKGAVSENEVYQLIKRAKGHL